MRHPILAPLAGLLLASPIAAQAVVPVADEPFHRTALLTPAARVLDIHMQPGDSTAYHSHARPYFWVVISGQQFHSQLPGGAAAPVAFAPGHVGFTAATESAPLVHRVFDRAPVGFHLVSAELDPGYLATCARRAPEPAARGAEMIFDTLGVTVQRVRLAPGETLAAGSAGAQLWISLTPGLIAVSPSASDLEVATELDAGQFIWAGKRGALRNPGSSRMDAVVIRWRECVEAKRE